MATVFAAAAAVLAGTARSTRQQDRLAGCLANLRAIGAASLAYAAADPNELLIPLPDLSVLPNGIGDCEWGGKAGRGQSSVVGDIAYSYWGTRNFRGPAHRPLNAVLYRGGVNDWNPVDGTPQPGPGGINYIGDTNLDLDVYRCSADTGYVGGGFVYTGGINRNPQTDEAPFRAEGRTAYDHFGTSYAARTLYIVGGLGGSRLRSLSVLFAPLSTIPNPGRTLAYNEIPSRYTWKWGDWSSSNCGSGGGAEGNFNTISGWHGRDFHFSVAFADGRAALVEMKGCIRPTPNLGQPNYPSSGCGGGVGGYECWRCVTFRGPDWQNDTLPAPAVVTPWDASGRSAGPSPGGAAHPVSLVQ